MFLCVNVKRIYRPLYASKEGSGGWIFASIDYHLKPNCHSATQVICIDLYLTLCDGCILKFVMLCASRINCWQNKSSEHEINMACFCYYTCCHPGAL